MQIKWYGHSCFLLSGSGVRVLTDPCAPTTGYRLSDIGADVVTSSHAHYDHNYFVAVRGFPAIVNTAGGHAFGEEGAGRVRITGIPTWHDASHGSERGENLVFVIEMDGLRIVHLGDIGHVPEAETAEAIGRPDVLFLPVGGTYTIDAAGALETVSLLRPGLVVPMHYRTPALAFPLDGPEAFLAGLSGIAGPAGHTGYTIHRLGQSECSVSPDTLGTPRALLFEYER